jgi:hypothetical protein
MMIFKQMGEYFRVLKKHSHGGSLKDDENNSISHSSEEFSFIYASLLQPGTVVVKIGPASGITSGHIIGIRNVTFEHRGSIFDANLSSFTYPIAIHRAQVTFTSSNYLVPGGACLHQVGFCGGPLRAVIEKFKEHTDIVTLPMK